MNVGYPMRPVTSIAYQPVIRPIVRIGTRFEGITFKAQPCKQEEVLPMLQMTNEIEAGVSGRRYTLKTLQKAEQRLWQRVLAGKMDLDIIKDKGQIIASASLDEDHKNPE